MTIEISAKSPMEMWAKLNLGCCSDNWISRWMDIEKGWINLYSFNNLLTIHSWDRLIKPDIKYFLGIGKPSMKMNGLWGKYIDDQELEAMRVVCEDRGAESPTVIAAGMNFKKTTVTRHGACLTAFHVTFIPGEKPEVTITLRAADINRMMFWDFLLFDQLIEFFGLPRPLKVTIFATTMIFSVVLGGVCMVPLFGWNNIPSLELKKQIKENWNKDPKGIKYKRVKRALIQSHSMAKTKKEENEGIVWPHIENQVDIEELIRWQRGQKKK